jgi:hypothetical protein
MCSVAEHDIDNHSSHQHLLICDNKLNICACFFLFQFFLILLLNNTSVGYILSAHYDSFIYPLKEGALQLVFRAYFKNKQKIGRLQVAFCINKKL